MGNNKKCEHCHDKFKCYDRMMSGRMNQCEPEEHKQQMINWKWFELYAETPAERKRCRQNYIALCEAMWELKGR